LAEADAKHRDSASHQIFQHVGDRFCGRSPGGELAALHRSTGIADIVVGRPMPAGQARALRLLSPLLQGALAVPAIRRFASRDRGSALDPAPTPPDGWRSRIWAEARNSRGDVVLLTPRRWRSMFVLVWLFNGLISVVHQRIRELCGQVGSLPADH
jgi:hypothetical protein